MATDAPQPSRPFVQPRSASWGPAWNVGEGRNPQALLTFYKQALDQSAIVAITDAAGIITYVNEQFCRISGYNAQELLGQTHRVVNSGYHPQAFFTEMYATIARGDAWRGEICNRAKDGSLYWVDTVIVPFLAESGKVEHYVAIRQDITARHVALQALRESEQHAQQIARRDQLTGLPNRDVFSQRLNEALALARRDPSQRFAVLFLDFDRFKAVNDSLGHDAGDALLVHIANRLRDQLRNHDLAARFGGDEFVLLLQDIEDSQHVQNVCDRLLTEFGQPHFIHGQEIVTTPSIGVVLSDMGHDTPEQIIRDADAAMYQAKASGRSCYRVFDAQMHHYAVESLELERELRCAPFDEQFKLLYQPIVCLHDRTPVAFEALLRWHHPQRGIVSPLRFIPIAEETGLIVPLGQWVIHEACRQLAKWRQQFPGIDLQISVNLSRRQLLYPGLQTTLENALQSNQISPHLLKLEVTESTIMDEHAAMADVLHQIRTLGVQLAMDDFGTGHSSLACLHTFPIDDLKLDRTFLLHMTDRREFAGVVQAIITLAHHLGAQVVAEGIETAEQLAALQAMDCAFGQGYYFAKPMPPADAAAYLQAYLPNAGDASAAA